LQEKDNFGEGEAVDLATDRIKIDQLATVVMEGLKEYADLATEDLKAAVESKVEAVLDDRGIFYNKSEVWIGSEKLYEVLYSFELPVTE
jgi:hypothetical protein